VPDICGCITTVEDVDRAIAVANHVALYEVRIDLVGTEWRSIVGELPRPWIACHRSPSEGGQGSADVDERLAALEEAVAAGASFVDVEVAMPDVRNRARKLARNARVILSYHDFEGTPDAQSLRNIVAGEVQCGADICKVVTTCTSVDDNVRLLRLYRGVRQSGLVAFGMGPMGAVSRVLAPLHGASFTYASLADGHESAPGQLTVEHLVAFYEGLG